MALPPRPMYFAVGRVNFVDWKGGPDDYDGKADFLVQTISQGKEYIEYRRDRPDEVSAVWMITDEFHDEVTDTLYAWLVKEKETKGAQFIDRDQRKLRFNPSDMRHDVSAAYFVIDLTTHVILYQYNASIRRGAFERVLPELFNPNRLVEPPFEIDDVVDSTALGDWVRKVRVTEIELEAVPSNPRPRKSNEAFDAALRELRAKKAKLIITGRDVEPPDVHDDQPALPETDAKTLPDTAAAVDQPPPGDDVASHNDHQELVVPEDKENRGLNLHPDSPRNFVDEFLDHAAGGYGKFLLRGITPDGETSEFQSGRNVEKIIIPGTNEPNELRVRLQRELHKALRFFNL